MSPDIRIQEVRNPFDCLGLGGVEIWKIFLGQRFSNRKKHGKEFSLIVNHEELWYNTVIYIFYMI